MKFRHPIEAIAERSENLIGLRRSIEADIPCIPNNDGVREKLTQKTFSDLIATYVNWVDRIIVPRKRTPLAWDGFWTTLDSGMISTV